MPEPTSQVVEAENQSVSPETTPAAGVAESTPSQQPSNDAERIRVEYEQKLAASQRDINQLKSTLQRQIGQKEAEWSAKYADLQKQFREVRLGTMDENQRKQYEVQMQTEELNNLRQQLAEAQAKQQEIASIADAQNFFLGKGIPRDKLVLDQGYEALVQSGWDAVSEELEGYRKGKTPSSQQPAPLQTAPAVVTDKSAPTAKTSWAEIVKKYGSEEKVFQLAEQGYISLANVEIPPVV